MRISFGRKDDLAVSGDWDGDGATNIGIYRPGGSRFFLDTDWDQFGNFVVPYGITGDLPISGDWNGDGKPDYGIFRR